MLSHAELAAIAGRCYRKPWSGRAALDCEYDLLPRGDEELVVAIPGTHPDDPLDWIRDLRMLPRPFPAVGVSIPASAPAAWRSLKASSPRSEATRA